MYVHNCLEHEKKNIDEPEAVQPLINEPHLIDQQAGTTTAEDDKLWEFSSKKTNFL